MPSVWGLKRLVYETNMPLDYTNLSLDYIYIHTYIYVYMSVCMYVCMWVCVCVCVCACVRVCVCVHTYAGAGTGWFPKKRSTFCLHSAFKDNTAPPDCPKRRSIEVRLVAFFWMPRYGFPMLLLRLSALLDAEALYWLKSSSIICTCSPWMCIQALDFPPCSLSLFRKTRGLEGKILY
jgi:hypothetical protein